MFKLDLEKAEELEIKLPYPLDHRKSKRILEEISTSASLTMPKPLNVWITTNWKILQETEISDHLPCLLRNLYSGQEATVRTRHGTTDWFQIGKGIHQDCILSPCIFNSVQSTSCETLGWMKHKLGSRLPGEISITSNMQMTPALWQKAKRN